MRCKECNRWIQLPTHKYTRVDTQVKEYLCECGYKNVALEYGACKEVNGVVSEDRNKKDR